MVNFCVLIDEDAQEFLDTMRRKSLYLIDDYISLMFAEYIQAAMDKATYEIIDDLIDALEDWIAAHLAWGYPVPPLEGHMIQVSKELMAVAD